jgi:hypothetical protein
VTRTLAAVLMMWSSTSALAADCPAPEGAGRGAISTQSPELRLAFLSKVIGEEATATRTWKLLWGAGYGLITMGQLALLSVTLASDSPDWVVGAAASSVGFATIVVGGLEVTEEGHRFVERARAATPEQTCALLIDGERMLREGAAAESFSTGFVAHAANVLFNVGMGLVLGLGYGHWRTAGINFGVGTVIGGATAFTRPTGLVKGWAQYQRGAEAEPKVTVRLVPSGIGAGVLFTF